MLDDRELLAAVAAHIDNLGLPPGGCVPTENQLCRKFGVTRYRARKAVRLLAAERDWVTVQGAGTFLPGGGKEHKPREKVIALVAPSGGLSDAQMVRAQRAAMAAGFHLVVFGVPHATPEFEEECLEFILGRHLHGLIIEPHPAGKNNFALVDKIIAAGTLCVFLNAPEELRRKYHLFALNYDKAGYLAVARLLREGVRKIIQVTPWRSVAWQHAAFLRGVREAAADLSAPLEVYEGRMVADPSHVAYRWQPEGFAVPLEDDAGYISGDSVMSASALFKLLRERGRERAPVISLARVPERLPYPHLYFDDDARLGEALAFLTGPAGRRGKTRRLFNPVLVEPPGVLQEQPEPRPDAQEHGRGVVQPPTPA